MVIGATAVVMREAAVVPEPELSFVRRMAETNGRWEHHGDYAIWCGHREPEEAPYALYELRPEGVLPVPAMSTTPILHRVAAGTPFYIAHLAGFWHVADTDAVWLESIQNGTRSYSIMLGGVVDAFGRNEVLWICRKCRHELRRGAFDTRAHGFGAFLPYALEQVRAFNADPRARTCAKCRAVHPLAYGFYAKADNAEESAARAAG